MAPPDELKLIRRLDEIAREIGRLEEQRETPRARKQRSVELGSGAAIGIGGLLFAPPTGGLTLIFSAVGMWLFVRSVEADAKADNRSREANRTLADLRREYDDIRKKLGL